jgi:hypothetical protein
MENNRKDYLFRLGPLIFFPKSEPKPPAYLDHFEPYRNIFRIIVVVIYAPMIFLAISDLTMAGEFLSRFDSWPTSYYYIFFFPLVDSLIDVYLVWLERKTRIPMLRHSKKLIYGSWTISSLYYLMFILGYILYLKQ